MNWNQIMNMLLRMLVRKGIDAGIKTGTNALSKRSRSNRREQSAEDNDTQA